MSEVAVLAAILTAFSTFGSARSASGFTPQAAAAIAERIPSALPPAARWNPSWGMAARAAVMERMRDEDENPESALPWHRCAAGDVLATPGDDDASSGRAAILGLAPHRLVLVAESLREAFVTGDDARIALAIAELAMTTTDLADPFQVTTLDRDEVETARARFSDVFGPADLDGLVPAERAVPASVLAGALELAARSALEREVVENAVRAGDEAGLKASRKSRLEEALALARSVLVTSWNAANAPGVEVGGLLPGHLRVVPNPVRSRATLSFALPRAAAATIELFDATGRRCWTRALGHRPAGPQGAMFAPGLFEGLPPGLYLVAITAGEFRTAARLIHVR